MRSYVFPGQGVQKKGMGRGLFEDFRDLCRQADEVLGYSVETLCLENPERLLNRTEYAQPAIYVVNALYYLSLRRQDLPPADYLAGHSLGEYNALFAAGAFDFHTGLTLVKRRADLMGKADGGGMAAVVGVSETAIKATLEMNNAAGVVIANSTLLSNSCSPGTRMSWSGSGRSSRMWKAFVDSFLFGSAGPSIRREWRWQPRRSGSFWTRSTLVSSRHRSSPT